jgi:anti-sigma factor ChrR (cupin superfamily)
MWGLIANPEGTTHSVSSEEGCVVLIQWTKPVKIL